MKIAFFSLFLATFLAASCRRNPLPLMRRGNVSFKVKLDETRHTPAAPAPGKALVYFIHDAGSDAVIAYPTTKFAWTAHGPAPITATPISLFPLLRRASSLRHFAVLPVDDRFEFAHFTAEAGKVYFFRTRLVLSGRWSYCNWNRSTAIRALSCRHLPARHFNPQEVKFPPARKPAPNPAE